MNLMRWRDSRPGPQPAKRRTAAPACGKNDPAPRILAVLAGAPVRAGERGVLLGPVMADRRHPDDLALVGQLHRPGDDRDRQLLPCHARPAAEFVPANDAAPPPSAILVTTGPWSPGPWPWPARRRDPAEGAAHARRPEAADGRSAVLSYIVGYTEPSTGRESGTAAAELGLRPAVMLVGLAGFEPTTP